MAKRTGARHPGPALRIAALAGIVLFGALIAPAAEGADLRTPLEASAYKTVPKTGEVIAFLRRLADASPDTTLDIIGHSAGGLPLAALNIQARSRPAGEAGDPGQGLTVLLIGSQHGTEPSGAEALQGLARDLASGRAEAGLKTMNIVIVPVANPDGRDAHRRANGNGANLSTDFLVQTQPETRALAALIRRIRPEVILDVHESAIYKPRSLGAQGFMTDFETQFEVPTHPNIPAGLRRLARDRVLPRVIEILAKSGQRAARYIGEITDIEQPITRGGLTLRNLRNYAGMMGILCMTVENRLDPRGDYPTRRNIKVRVGKQLRSVTAFLSVIAGQRTDILRATAGARRRLADPSGHSPIALVTGYVADEARPTIRLPMASIRRDARGRVVIGRRITREFAYHGRTWKDLVIPMPRAYVVTAFQPDIRALLERHGIAFETVSRQRKERLVVQKIESAERRRLPHGQLGTVLEVRTRADVATRTLRPGDLWVDLDQPQGRLVPLMLDPRSSTSIYQDPAFASHIRIGHDHYAAAVP